MKSCVPGDFGMERGPDQVALFDRDAFIGGSGAADEKAANQDGQWAGTYSAHELAEETWIDQNSVPLQINRYNGTLVRGE